MSGRRLVTVVLCATTLIFAIQNHQLVEVRFLWWSFAMNRAALLFMVFVAGLLAGNLAVQPWPRRRPK